MRTRRPWNGMPRWMRVCAGFARESQVAVLTCRRRCTMHGPQAALVETNYVCSWSNGSLTRMGRMNMYIYIYKSCINISIYRAVYLSNVIWIYFRTQLGQKLFTILIHIGLYIYMHIYIPSIYICKNLLNTIRYTWGTSNLTVPPRTSSWTQWRRWSNGRMRTSRRLSQDGLHRRKWKLSWSGTSPSTELLVQAFWHIVFDCICGAQLSSYAPPYLM